MSDPDRIPTAPTHAAPPDSADWQPLPLRARALCVLGALPLAVPAAVAGFVLGTAFDRHLPLLSSTGGAVLGATLGLGFGAWLGLKHYRHTFWHLDDDGLAIRRGKLWQRETRVPATRVQHLDLKRGPLQRRRRLATLVVHTAGTRHSAVTLAHLDVDDAERLRDHLGRQNDDVDA
ncbi:PH domain-containing protein [Lysobacter cavernae]|uniref:PH domain-containing protein n=1 Tax=Lysobacter cavernae TaxID=1685901 RepID=A0ABV7RRM4_9GAMM